MKTILMLIVVSFPGLSFVSGAEKITVKGSDTMVILGQRWAEMYMRAHKDVIIQVTGGGSGTGISALINGTTDICNSSRPIKESERAKLSEKQGSRGVEIKCALDGLAIYVHESNPVKELTLGQIKDIYVGKIKNWKEVGGLDQRIILYSRENNSGTYVYFKDEVLGGMDFAKNAQNMAGTAAVVNAVAKDKASIGYGGAAYGKGIRELSVKQDATSPAYAPTMENIRTGKYPISRFLFMYTKSRPSGALKKYIDWTLSAEGQKIVGEVGYFPIR
ncbi:MAG: phosphate ABC transporter substrate-binding protein [Bacteroidetes bacterium]|nr:phosphate ABC transporter substrate-binding protein [Bacteroidota bacterium]MCW5896513.1 phosphate ABC transporter substrate-binding protein [Bacteroidota bacterium]